MARHQNQVAVAGIASLVVVGGSLVLLSNHDHGHGLANPAPSSTISEASMRKTPQLKLNEEMPRHVRELLLNSFENSLSQESLPSSGTHTSLRRDRSLSITYHHLPDDDDDDGCIGSYHMSIRPTDPGYPATCTNSDYYPPDWDQPSIRPHLFFKNEKDCCEAYFGVDGDCNVVNVCSSVSNSGEPTSGKEECGDWHPDRNDRWTCTNSNNYPDDWKGVPAYFFPSGDECCQGYFNGPCTKVDACNSGTMEEQSSGTDTITTAPTSHPTSSPTHPLTSEPTKSPTDAPINSPTNIPSKKPTKSPTIQPTSFPTKFTHCPENKWHITTAPGVSFTCTNDKDYPSSWDDFSEAQQRNIFFDSGGECCKTLFGTSVEGDGCTIIDSCVATTTTTTTTTTTSTVAPVNLQPCPGNHWHISTTAPPGSKVCTNDNEYPPAWDTYPPQAQANFFFDDYHTCCIKLFESMAGCEKVEVCDSTAVATTSTTVAPISGETGNTQGCSTKWHISTQSGSVRTCTNDDQYPAVWDTLTAEQQVNFFFGSWESCCEQLFGGVDTCAKVEVCDEENTMEEQSSALCGDWHPSTEAANTCSNTLDVPPEWENIPTLFYPDHNSCCQGYFDQDCAKDDACADPESPPTNLPTSAPTNVPIASPTMGPTNAQTSMPTSLPTNAPTAGASSPPSSLPTSTPTGRPTSAPTANPTDAQVASTTYVSITKGGDNFEGVEDPSGPIPWVFGNPPQWIIDDTVALDGTKALRNVLPAGEGDYSDATMHLNVSSMTIVRCQAKIDVQMPFDTFELVVDGQKRNVYAEKKDDWVSVVTGIEAGEHTVVFRVQKAEMIPPIPRNPSTFGTGYVWLDMCMIQPVA